MLAALLVSCSQSGATAQVKADLESMRHIELDPEMTEEISGMLGSEGKDDMEEFLEKAGEFDFDIQKTEDGEDYSLVTVRITSYCFGREYLKTWNDYLEKEGDGEFDPASFYSMLMDNLSEVEDKTFSRKVTITCIDDDSGNWTTDALSNSELRNAIFGGMLREIAALAE